MSVLHTRSIVVGILAVITVNVLSLTAVKLGLIEVGRSMNVWWLSMSEAVKLLLQLGEDLFAVACTLIVLGLLGWRASRR